MHAVLKQDRQCKQNITFRRVCASILKRKIIKCYIFWMCIFRLRYSTCNAHAPYCHLQPARFYSIFLHYLIKSTIFGKRLLSIKYVFCFYLQLLSHAFLILRRTERDVIENLYWSSYKLSEFLSDFNKNLIFSTDFRKIFRNLFSWKSVM
jgi:hypothetical protein